MIETVDSEWLKTETELTHILRWEDDGGAAIEEENNPIPQVTETSTPRLMDVTGESLYYKEKTTS